MGNELIRVEYDLRTLETLKVQVDALVSLMRDMMVVDEHYGTIQGTTKPSLYKPGAELICQMFRLIPVYDDSEIPLQGDHRQYKTTCYLHFGHAGGPIMGQCSASCSTMESKFRWRKAERTCPACGAAAIIQSKDFKTHEKDGWLCYAKKGGCGAKFALGDESIEGQIIGRVECPDIADYWNPCLKMAQKRAYVGAAIQATAASRFFTQDVEDMPLEAFQGHKVEPKSKPIDITPKVEPIEEPEPLVILPNPWEHQLEGSKTKKGCYLFEIEERDLIKALGPRVRLTLTPLDIGSIEAALASPELRAVATEAFTQKMIKEAESGSDADEIVCLGSSEEEENE